MLILKSKHSFPTAYIKAPYFNILFKFNFGRNFNLYIIVGIKTQNNMLGLRLLFEDAKWSEEGQIVI